MKGSLDLIQGTLDILILKALSWEPMHGYQVSSWIQGQSDRELQIEEGTLYPALHRLEERRLVEAEWGLSENNRRAKFYRLTQAGRDALNERTAVWERYSRAVGRILSAVRP